MNTHTKPASSSEDRIPALFLVKAATRGVVVWATYAVAGTLLSWVCGLITLRTLWGGAGGFGHGHVSSGPVATVVLLLYAPEILATLLFVLGIPALSIALGSTMGVRAAMKHALSQKAALLVDGITRIAWPVCEKLSAQGTAVATLDAANGINQRIEASNTGVLRWLLRRVSTALRLPALLSSADFLALARTQPDQARQMLSTRVQDELQARVKGHAVFTALFVVLGATVLATVAILVAWPIR